MSEDEYRVYLVPLPGDVKAAVRVGVDGFASIYINDSLSPEAQRQAFRHELRHIERDDHYNDLSIEEVEAS